MTISDSPRIHAWRPAAFLRVGGPDAFTFLQGQLTNDLGRLKSGSPVYGLWLNQKARVLADSFVLQGSGPEEFLVCSYFSPGAAIRERLESYIIADDVGVADATTEWFGTALVGAELTGKAQAAADGLVFPGRRGLDNQLEWMARRPLEIAGAPVLTAEDLERARIRGGIPAIPMDIGPGELPNEGALEADAISYTKGCYLGQEVIARLKAMGQVRRRLERVSGAGEPPPRLAKLYQHSRPVGELRSVASDSAGFIGLALLTLLHLQRDAALSLVPDGPPVLKLEGAP
jgi:folate-binding protein YgfZ